jgi:hypothetical protein
VSRWLLLIAAVVVAIVTLCLHPIPQSLNYHNFADHRAWLGVPNVGDVVSNAPFAIVGLWGITFLGLISLEPSRLARHFATRDERWPYMFVFLGLLFTAIGSAYYHLEPNNETLVWDRLPMTIVFTSLVAAVIAERINVRLGLYLWPFLGLIGAYSVEQWQASELAGHGDLRFYAAIQFYSALVLLLALFLPSRYTRASDFGIIVGFYVLAKILESADKIIFSVGHIVSGHTLKHLAAAGAGYWILRMLKERQPLTPSL